MDLTADMEPYAKLSEAISAAKERARKARGQAHCPYSEFSVGAGLVAGSDGTFRICGGSNVEFPGRRGIHAEQLAISKAVINGAREIHGIAVSCSDEGGHIPCGICLSTMTEFAEDMSIFADCGGGVWKATTLKRELPNAYGGTERMKDV